MKQKNIFFLTILFFLISHSSLYSQYIDFTQPTDNETVFITSGTSTNIVVNWTSSDKSGTVSSYVVLQTHNNSYTSISKPYTVYNIPAGDYSWTIKLYNIDGNQNTTYDSDQVNFTVDYQSYSITAENDMDGYTGGVIKVGVNQSAVQKTSPYSFPAESGNTVYLEAVENQSYNTYNWIWNDSEAPLYKSRWRKRYTDGSSELKGEIQNISFTAVTDDHNSTYEAGLRKECDISLSNQFSGTSMGGEMQINGTWVTSIPTTETVVEQNLLSVSAKEYYDANNIRYLFDKWSDNNTNRFRSIYPSAHGTYTALYKGYAIYTDQMRGLSFSGVREGDVYYIKLNWSDHPNTNVTQYKIYRYTQGPDGTTSPVLISTKSRGTTTFTDYSYAYAPSTGEYRIYYDVKAYFSLDGTTSSDNYEQVRGEEIDNQAQKKGSQSEELIKEYAISNFPNPFNPTTRIAYQLPKAGHVQIKVYDAIGKEVATLVNKHMEVGKYEVSFGKNDLPSGMYIYTIKVNDYFASKKMLLIK